MSTPKRATFAPISLERLERDKGDFRAQLPDVNPIRIALDWGYLLDCYLDEAEELRARVALAMVQGSEACAKEPFVGMVPLVNEKLRDGLGREYYLRFILKHLQPDAFDKCREFFKERTEAVKVRLLDLAKPHLVYRPDQRPMRWSDKSTFCKEWMGTVVEQIEGRVGGELRTHL